MSNIDVTELPGIKWQIGMSIAGDSLKYALLERLPIHGDKPDLSDDTTAWLLYGQMVEHYAYRWSFRLWMGAEIEVERCDERYPWEAKEFGRDPDKKTFGQLVVECWQWIAEQERNDE